MPLFENVPGSMMFRAGSSLNGASLENFRGKAEGREILKMLSAGGGKWGNSKVPPPRREKASYVNDFGGTYEFRLVAPSFQNHAVPALE